jgi:hypothetical protein
MTSIASRPIDSATQDALLNWHRSDIEQRLGFTGARFTNVNGVLSFLAAAAMSVLFYAALYPIRRTYFAVMFTERGWVPYCIVLLSAWSTAILAIKYAKLRFQARALHYNVVLECSPKVDPDVMRDQPAWKARRTLDERQATQPGADHQEAA